MLKLNRFIDDLVKSAEKSPGRVVTGKARADADAIAAQRYRAAESRMLQKQQQEMPTEDSIRKSIERHQRKVERQQAREQSKGFVKNQDRAYEMALQEDAAWMKTQKGREYENRKKWEALDRKKAQQELERQQQIEAQQYRQRINEANQPPENTGPTPGQLRDQEFREYEQQLEAQRQQERHQQRRENFNVGMNEVKEQVMTPHYSKALNVSDKEFQVAYGKHMKDESFANASAFEKRQIMNDYFIDQEARNRVSVNPDSRGYNRALEKARQSVYSDINAAKQRAPGSPGSFNFDNASKGAQHAFKKADQMNDFYRQNSKSLTNEEIKKRALDEYKNFGLTEENYGKFADNTNGFRDEILASRANHAGLNPTMMDNMWGNKVPQIAGGALLTAGLVSSLSNSKGQQSNAALYGQQPYY